MQHVVTTSHPMPETTEACRILLFSVGMEKHWPSLEAAVWLASGNLPADLTTNQWTMLRVCQSLSSLDPGPAFGELLDLDPRPLGLVSSLLHAWSLDALGAWVEQHSVEGR